MRRLPYLFTGGKAYAGHRPPCQVAIATSLLVIALDSVFGLATSVFYRDRWFWVDDGDLRSKRVFMFLMIFSALSETRAVPQLPIVTIPTN